MHRALITVAVLVLFISAAYSEDLDSLRAQAGQGDAEAQALLGGLYLEGHDVPQDYAEARKWLERAAGQGDADAQALLGIMYFLGQGVAVDYAEAAKWLRRGAGQGHAGAQTLLARLYTLGMGVPQDFVEAHKWLNLAAARGDVDLGQSRDDLAKNMTPEQVAEAQRLAREWQPKKE